MRCEIRFLICLIACAVAPLGCGPSLYIPTVADATSTASLEELTEGRELYIDRCSGCHGIHRPEEFNETAWRRKLDEMQPRAKLTEGEKALIRKYLLSGHQKQ